MFSKICVGILLGVSTIIDLKSKKISAAVLAVFTVIWFPYYLLTRFLSIYSIGGGIAIGIFMMVMSRVLKGGIGIGDGMLLCVLGGYLGFIQNLKLLLTALYLAAGCSVVLLLIKRAGKKTEIPFVPFLCTAYIGSIILEVIQ